MNDQERLTAVEGCKFVDEVIPAVPYVMTAPYLDYVIKKYKVDYVVHGDDPCIVDGKDVYESAKKEGMYQSIPRTEGVSTTDIVGRMLLMTKDHHKKEKGGLVSEGNEGGGEEVREIGENIRSESVSETESPNQPQRTYPPSAGRR